MSSSTRSFSTTRSLSTTRSSSLTINNTLTAVVVDGAGRGRIRRMVKNLMKQTIIGFDAEWTSHGAMTIIGQKTRISHLIFSNGDIAYVFILGSHPTLPDPVLSFLRHPEITFVGMGIEENIAKLKEVYQASCRNAVELGRLAEKITKNPRLRSCGVDFLAREISITKNPRPYYVEFEVGFEKPYRSYDIFENYELDEGAVSEAVANTCAYKYIGQKLLEGCY